MEIKHNNIQFQIDKLLVAVVATYPLLNVYATCIGGVGVGDFLFIVFSPYMIFRFVDGHIIEKKYIKMFYRLLLYAGYCIIISCFNLIIHSDYDCKSVFIRLLVEFFYIFVLCYIVIRTRLNFSLLIKVYTFVGLTVSVGIILQYIFYHFWNVESYLLAKNINYNQSTLPNFAAYIKKYAGIYKYVYRPTSFFLEPSHYALYVAPLLSYLLNCKKKTNLLQVAILSVGIVLSTSGVGYVLLALSWGWYFITSIKSWKIKIYKLFLILFLFSAMIVVLFRGGYFMTLISRLKGLSVGAQNSISIRLLNGFETYFSLPISMKICGMGCGTYESYIISLTGFKSSEYMNSISYILVSTGIVGLLLFMYYISGLFKLGTVHGVTVLVVELLSIYLTGSTLFSCYDTMFLVLIFCIEDVHDGSMDNYLIMKKVQNNRFIFNNIA